MTKKPKDEKDVDNGFGRVLPIAIVAFAIGYFVADDAFVVKQLRTELEGFQQKQPTTEENRGLARKLRITTRDSSHRNPLAEDPNGLIARLGVTPDELQLTDELNARQKDGEYILKMERPTTRKFLDDDFKSIVAQQAPDLAARYDPVFEDFGIAPEAGAKLKTHLSKIQRASLEATVTMQQLEESRQEYDKKLRSMLSDDDYTRYKDFENAKPATMEFEVLQEFAKSISAESALPEYRELIIRAIQETGASSKTPKDGPYDAPPVPVIGFEKVLRKLEDQRDKIKDRSPPLLQRAEELGLPPEVVGLLKAFREDEFNRKQTSIENVLSRARERGITVAN